MLYITTHLDGLEVRVTDLEALCLSFGLCFYKSTSLKSTCRLINLILCIGLKFYVVPS